MNKYLVKLITIFIPLKKHRKKIRSILNKKHHLKNIKPQVLKNQTYPNELKKQINSNQTCFIIGNSPSNKQLDLSLLNDKFTITVGSGFKLKELGLNNSTIQIFGDIQGYADLKGKIEPNFSKYYYLLDCLKPEKWMKNVTQFSLHNYGQPCEMKFEKDINKPLFHNHSVISAALQMAIFLGFKEIVFLGVDLDFNNQKGHSYTSTNNEQKRQIEISLNKQDKMLEWLTFACKEAEKLNVKCYNASPSGKLNFIKRVKLTEFIKIN